MGKKKITTIDDSQATIKKEAKPKKTIFRWESAYEDLNNRTATALREARVKPDQLTAMTDGEITALEGIGPTGLEEIRKAYPAKIEDKPTSKTKKTTKTKSPKSVEPEAASHPRTRSPRHLHGRSHTYKAKLELKDKPLYSLADAIKTLRQITYSVHKTIELHVNTKEKGFRGEINLPHGIGKTTKVAIFSPELVVDIKKGKLDFDILLARPSDMGNIAPLAKILGPKGLMPNPKSGTITDKPQDRAKELSSASTLAYRTEPKAAIIHTTIGSLDLTDDQILANLKAILKDIGAHRINSAFIKSTMSPSVKLDLSSL